MASKGRVGKGRQAEAAGGGKDAARAPGREGRRLLAALAQEGAAPARSDLRDGFLVVAGPRNGVTAIIANTPVSAGDELVAQGFARWTAHLPPRLALTAEGAGAARRLAAPADVGPYRAQHGDLVMRALEPGARPVAVDEAESPLGWLARRKGRDGAPLLNSAQVEAGERFRRDVEIAQIRQRVTSDWSGAAGSGRRGPQDLNVSDLAIAWRARLMLSAPNSTTSCSTSAACRRASNSSNAKDCGRRDRPRSCCASRSIGSRRTTDWPRRRGDRKARACAAGARPAIGRVSESLTRNSLRSRSPHAEEAAKPPSRSMIRSCVSWPPFETPLRGSSG